MKAPEGAVPSPSPDRHAATRSRRASSSLSNVAMNAWLPQASYPCGNFSDTSSFKSRRAKGSLGHAFTDTCVMVLPDGLKEDKRFVTRLGPIFCSNNEEEHNYYESYKHELMMWDKKVCFVVPGNNEEEAECSGRPHEEEAESGRPHSPPQRKKRCRRDYSQPDGPRRSPRVRERSE
ncbi:hypothetical protein SOVF_156580 [Spinacia oleracea]|nr:hypothetical protein SOVF_156580 [Spinacia oleracea]